MIKLRKKEQEGDEAIDSDEEAELKKNLEKPEADGMNFMTKLYEDEKFLKEKAMMEEQIQQATQVTMESKSFIQEMDGFLKDLESWKSKRAVR